MPTPRSSYQNTVEQAPFSGSRLRPADFDTGETIGRAVQSFGQQVEGAGRALERIDISFAEAAAKKADTGALVELSEARAEFEGLEAFDAQGATERFKQRTEEIKKKYGADLKHPLAQQMFSDTFAQRAAANAAGVQAHEIKQVRVANVEASKARASASIDAAADAYADPEAFQQHVGTAVSELRSLFPGAGPEVLARKEAELRSTAHVKVIERLTATDPVEAEAWREANSEEILPDAESAIIKSLQPSLDEAELDVGIGKVEELASDPNWQPGAEPAEGTEPTEGGTEAAVSPYDPTRGMGRVTNTAAQHRARESGNGLDVAAPEGTALYPPMSGKVVRVFNNTDDNGYGVMVQHPNGYVTGYAHMKSKPPVGVGDEVTSSTIIGAVGSTGRSTGPHVHYTVRQSPDGPKVDPQSVKWRDGDRADLPVFNPERNDAKRLYDAARQVAIERGYSRKQYDALLRRVDQKVAREDGLRARAIQDTEEKVWSRIMELGDDFKRLDQLPVGIGLLPASSRQQIMDRIEENTAPKEPEAYGDVFWDLFSKSGSADPRDQQEFLRVDLRRVSGITNGERKELINRQAKIEKAASGDAASSAAAADYSRINTMINFIAKSGTDIGYDPFDKKESDEEKQRKRILHKRIVSEYERRSATEGRLSDKALADLIRTEVITTYLSGPVTGEVPRYVAREQVAILPGTKAKIRIPAADVERIRNKYGARGIELDDADVIRIYTSGQ